MSVVIIIKYYNYYYIALTKYKLLFNIIAYMYGIDHIKLYVLYAVFIAIVYTCLFCRINEANLIYSGTTTTETRHILPPNVFI